MSVARRLLARLISDEPDRVEVKDRLGAVELTVGLMFAGAGYAAWRLWSFADRIHTDRLILDQELAKLRARLDYLESGVAQQNRAASREAVAADPSTWIG